MIEKRFGRVHMIHLNVFWSRPQSYYDQGNGWRGTWEFDGGAFMNQASHYVDLLDWLIGSVEKVQAMMSTTRDIKVGNFGSSQNKLGYVYVLTPSGITEKVRLTGRFLARKKAEHEALRVEIDALSREIME
jgi:predicted dehydrogenase